MSEPPSSRKVTANNRGEFEEIWDGLDENFMPVPPGSYGLPLPADLPMKSLEEITKYIDHDWSKINPLRAAWIDKFNKDMAK